MSERLDQAMRQVLAELEMVSSGTIRSYNPSGRGGGTESPRPPGGRGAEYLYWHEQYGKAPTDVKRAAVIEAARKELAGLKRRDAPIAVGETAEQLAARIVDKGAGWSLDEVVNHFHCLKSFAVRARRNAGRETDYGRPPVPTLDVEERRAHARRLRQQGRSVVSIALELGVHRNTVHRDLEDAA